MGGCDEGFSGNVVTALVGLCVVQPVGTMHRKGLTFLEAQWNFDFFACPLLVGVAVMILGDCLQDGTLACQSALLAGSEEAVVGLAAVFVLGKIFEKAS